MLSTQHVDMISIPDTELHLQRRRAWARGLAAKALREYEERMGARVGQLVGSLEEHKGEVLLLDEWFNRFT